MAAPNKDTDVSLQLRGGTDIALIQQDTFQVVHPSAPAIAFQQLSTSSRWAVIQSSVHLHCTMLSSMQSSSNPPKKCCKGLTTTFTVRQSTRRKRSGR